MIDLYTWTTPNGRKISIMLEEIGLPYRVIPVDLTKDEQHRPGFLAVNPNGKIPAIVDHDAPGGPLAVFESGAILIHLAEKTGRLLSTEVSARATTLEWLMFQMSQVGPMIGQTGHFLNQAPEKIPYAIQRFVGESVRILGVLETGLAGRDYLAGEYSIADVATYPWVAAAWPRFKEMMGDQAGPHGNVQRWLDRVAARPAVQRGMAIPPST
jgi:GSH-dependent disulfide-bond oxidoreductase